jgi:L-fuconolactonase
MYIDTHVHFWKLARGDYGWIKPDNAVLHQDYLPDQLLGSLSGLNVERIIAVQAASTVAETKYLLELAEQYPVIAGVVGWMDLEAASFEEEYAQLRTNPRFVGIRIGGGQIRKALESEGVFLARLRQLAADQMTVDLLVRPSDLTDVVKLLEAVPGLRAVIDHLGNPLSSLELEAQWEAGMQAAALYPQVMGKLSGMITPAGGFHPERLRSFVSRLFNWFGAERLMYGSDWPVALQAGAYEGVVRLFEELLDGGLSEGQLHALRSGNAEKFYLNRADWVEAEV